MPRIQNIAANVLNSCRRLNPNIGFCPPHRLPALTTIATMIFGICMLQRALALSTPNAASKAALGARCPLLARADIEQPLLELCFRSFDLVDDGPSRFLKGLGWRWEWHRCGQPQPIFVVYRYDETGLASEIEPVEIVRLGFEDHSLGSHSALKRLVPKSGVLPPDTFF